MTLALDGHIQIDENGTARIAGSRLKVIHLVMDMQAWGSTPEELQQGYALTLAQVHAALTYYYGHKPELDAQIEKIDREYDALRAADTKTPTKAELIARLRST